jgi:hypothetical protein
MNDTFRDYLATSLSGRGAHITFDQAIEGFPPERAGEQIPNLEHTAWMLVYHIRICMQEIIDYCMHPDNYQEIDYPSGLWPENPEPPSEDAWHGEIEGVRNGISTLHSWALDTNRDLFSPIPGTPGHNLFREMIIIIDHNSYHIGQLVDLRMLLGIPVKDW